MTLKEFIALDESQAADLSAAIQKDRLTALFVLRIACGMRQALRWEDVEAADKIGSSPGAR